LCTGDSIYFNEIWLKDSGNYSATFVSAEGCDSIHTITINELSLPDNPEIEIDCENELIIANINSASPWQILWDNGDTTNQTFYTDQSLAILTLSAFPDCEKQFTIDLPSLPQLDDLEELNDTIIDENSSLRIDLELDTEDWSILWSPSEVVDYDSCKSVIINSQSDVEVTVYLTHISGCEYESIFDVKVRSIAEEEIYFPNIFSPNGDGQNDLWSLDLSKYPINELAIFDRWGNQVGYWKNSPVINWDGRYNGKSLSQGVYAYILSYQDNSNIALRIVGDLTLTR
jgi:gliding motility-associated-like protein